MMTELSTRRVERITHYLTLSLALLVASPAFAATVKVKRPAMGSRFEITAVHRNESEARAAVEAAYDEIERIEAMISSWRETSETSEINRKAGVASVEVSPDLFNLIRRSIRVSRLTGGAFDITFDTVGRLWDFKTRSASPPSKSAINEALGSIGYQQIVLDEARHTVFLSKPGARIGFGAIGKGHAANRAVFVLKELGVSGGVVNAGGDLVIFGRQEDGSPWRIGIANPVDHEAVFAYIETTEQAVVTSGDYENYIEIDGKRYSHILDPRTGWPVDELRSVTIVCPDGELADALATGVSVLGVEEGLALINRLRGIEAMLVDRNGEIYFSDHLESMMIEPETE